MAKVVALLLCFLTLTIEKDLDDPTIDGDSSSDRHMEVYKRLFELKRREQVQTAEQVWAVTDYEKQFKTIKLIEEAIFPVLKQSLLGIAEFGYAPGSPLPEEQEEREGKIFENVAFFGDILLRMPDMTKKMAQEIGIIPEDADFTNPYRHHQNKVETNDINAAKKSPKKKKKSRPRGPQLRAGPRVDL